MGFRRNKMTTKDEALKMAIEDLEVVWGKDRESVIACREALEQPTNMVTIPLDKLEDMQRRLKEQPTQEPMIIKQDNGMVLKLGYDDLPNGTPFYTHPKEWQGLSEDEIWDIANFLGKNKEWDYPVMFAKTIEKALKEKNNGLYFK